VNLNEARTILLRYRHGTADADDPQIAAALDLARRDPELGRWLAEHGAIQAALRNSFRQIAVPAGLKEQILSEQAAQQRRNYWRPRVALTAVAAVALLLWLATFLVPRAPDDDTLAVYLNRMAGIALRGYGMDLTTNDPAPIRIYLARHQAPADYVLPAALQRANVTGCAVEGWQDRKVSMICFRTGRPLPPNQASDLWLFVVDRASLKEAPPAGPPRLALVNRLCTAVWSQGDKVYVLGLEGDDATLRRFL
jgi:uncharacterized membrane protein YbaN (DUF454 family)